MADSIARVLAIAALSNGGGEGGTTNYNELENKPKINGVTLSGNKTAEDLGISGGTTDYSELDNKPSINGVELNGNIAASDLGISGIEVAPTSEGDPASSLTDPVKQSSIDGGIYAAQSGGEPVLQSICLQKVHTPVVDGYEFTHFNDIPDSISENLTYLYQAYGNTTFSSSNTNTSFRKLVQTCVQSYKHINNGNLPDDSVNVITLPVITGATYLGCLRTLNLAYYAAHPEVTGTFVPLHELGNPELPFYGVEGAINDGYNSLNIPNVTINLEVEKPADMSWATLDGYPALATITGNAIRAGIYADGETRYILWACSDTTNIAANMRVEGDVIPSSGPDMQYCQIILRGGSAVVNTNTMPGEDAYEFVAYEGATGTYPFGQQSSSATGYFRYFGFSMYNGASFEREVLDNPDRAYSYGYFPSYYSSSFAYKKLAFNEDIPTSASQIMATNAQTVQQNLERIDERIDTEVQPKLTPGTGIIISEDNVISAIGGGGGGAAPDGKTIKYNSYDELETAVGGYRDFYAKGIPGFVNDGPYGGLYLNSSVLGNKFKNAFTEIGVEYPVTLDNIQVWDGYESFTPVSASIICNSISEGYTANYTLTVTYTTPSNPEASTWATDVYWYDISTGMYYSLYTQSSFGTAVRSFDLLSDLIDNDLYTYHKIDVKYLDIKAGTGLTIADDGKLNVRIRPSMGVSVWPHDGKDGGYEINVGGYGSLHSLDGGLAYLSPKANKRQFSTPEFENVYEMSEKEIVFINSIKPEQAGYTIGAIRCKYEKNGYSYNQISSLVVGSGAISIDDNSYTVLEAYSYIPSGQLHYQKLTNDADPDDIIYRIQLIDYDFESRDHIEIISDVIYGTFETNYQHKLSFRNTETNEVVGAMAFVDTFIEPYNNIASLGSAIASGNTRLVGSTFVPFVNGTAKPFVINPMTYITSAGRLKVRYADLTTDSDFTTYSYDDSEITVVDTVTEYYGI